MHDGGRTWSQPMKCFRTSESGIETTQTCWDLRIVLAISYRVRWSWRAERTIKDGSDYKTSRLTKSIGSKL
jgi:hypothetical protein